MSCVVKSVVASLLAEMCRSYPCASPSDADALRSLVATYITHPSQLQYNVRPLVSTFAGETCAFGQASPAEGWKTQFAQHPDLQGKISFVPSFMIDPTKFGDFAGVMDGAFNVGASIFMVEYI